MRIMQRNGESCLTTYSGVISTSKYAAPVEKTGQTTCYDTDGNIISCAGTGQDGQLQKGVVWPVPRFTDNGDGTVTDQLTGLIWLKNANCAGAIDWDAALSYCDTLHSGTCDLSDGSTAGDWRLPNRKELESLLDLGKINPALPEGHPFSGVQSSLYWSATTNAHYTHYTWLVVIYDGDVYFDYKSNNYYVWPVRGGQ